MGSIFGGGGQTAPATFSRGASPAAYIPYNQPGQDQLYNQLLTGLVSPSLSFMQGQGALPATQYWPSAQDLANQIPTYAAETGGGNPYVNPLIYYGAQAGQLAGQAAPQQFAQGGNILNQIPGMLSAGLNALVQGGNIYNQGQNIAAEGQGVFNLTPQLYNEGQNVLGSAQQVANTAFDPQQALYNQLINQTQQQSAAQNAMSGLSGTPYGAGLANQNLQNLAINWQNQQLGRQMQGLGALTQGYGAANQGLQDVLGGFGAANTGFGSAATGFNTGSLGGLQGFDSAILAALQAGQGGAGLQNTGIGTMAQAGSIPYNAYLGQAQNALSGINTGLQGLTGAVGLGNQQFQIPQQALNDIQSYLGLGQAASGLAGQLGGQGFNQGQAGLSNVLGLGALGSTLLTGSASPFGAGGLLGLLGGGAGAGGAAAGIGSDALDFGSLAALGFL